MRVNDLVGIRWDLEGSCPEEGLDCRGLVLWALDEHHQKPVTDFWEAFVTRAAKDPSALPEHYVPPGWVQVPLDEVRTWDVLYLGDQAGHHVALVGEAGWCLTTNREQGSHLVALRTMRRAARTAWRYVG